MYDESHIIKEIKSGNRQAFNELCSDFYPNMLAYARMFLNDEWADDVIQDVFFALWQKRSRLDEHKSLRSYLLRSVHNMSLNYLKIKERSQKYREWNKAKIALMSLNSSEQEGILRDLFEGEMEVAVNSALMTLSERQREIFKLSYVEELSNKEIGAQLGISSRTVESHLYQILKKMREHLTKEQMFLLLISLMSSQVFLDINQLLSN